MELFRGAVRKGVNSGSSVDNPKMDAQPSYNVSAMPIKFPWNSLSQITEKDNKDVVSRGLDAGREQALYRRGRDHQGRDQRARYLGGVRLGRRRRLGRQSGGR